MSALETLAEALPEMVWTAFPDGTIGFMNQRWTAFTGLSTGEALGWGWVRSVHPDDAPEAATLWRRRLRMGEPFELEYRLRNASGNYEWFLSKAEPQRETGGSVRRWIGMSSNIDAYRRAIGALRLLADTGPALGASLDLQSVLDGLLGVLVPRLCDWAVVALKSGNGLRVASILHRDPQKNHLAQQMTGELHHTVADPHVSPAYAALTSGEPQIWNAWSSIALERATRPEMLETIKLLGQRSALVVPLREGDAIVGTLGAARSESKEPFGKRDVPLLQDVADRASSAIRRVRVFERERLIADTLQHASLPQSLPDVPGYAFDAFYAPARSETKIGGDWYDVFEAGDRRIALTVGDVSGSGLQAAVAMGRIRNMIRTLCVQETDPAELLRAADAMLVRENPELLVTAIVGFLDAKERMLMFSTAGHLPPLMRIPGGEVVELPADGLPLTLLSPEHPLVTAAVRLQEGAVLVFYTDGLVEETRDIIEGQRLLREAIADGEILVAESPARFLYERLLPSGSHDDVAILTLTVGIPEGTAALRVRPAMWEARWRFEVLDFEAPANARDAFVRFLKTRGAPDADYAAAELIFGELIGNVVRHASAPLVVELDWTSDYPVLHVQDHGPGFDYRGADMPGPYAESGRGLAISAALAREFEVTRIPQYGTHVRAMLNIPRANAGAR